MAQARQHPSVRGGGDTAPDALLHGLAVALLLPAPMRRASVASLGCLTTSMDKPAA